MEGGGRVPDCEEQGDDAIQLSCCGEASPIASLAIVEVH
jgi:hypothetical protein